MVSAALNLPPQSARLILASDRLPSIPETLSGMPILHGIRESTLSLLAGGAERVEVERGAVIFGRGSTPTGLYFVVSGGVKLLSLGPDNRERAVELFEPGGMFGEIGTFTGAAYRTRTQAVAHSALVHVNRGAVLSAVDCDHALATRMLTAVTARAQRLIDSIGCTSPNTAAVRVAAYLLDLADRSPVGDAPMVLPAPKGTIASLLNLSQESLSRVLRRMKDAGLLVMTGRRIRIRDREGLMQIMDSEACSKAFS